MSTDIHDPEFVELVLEVLNIKYGIALSAKQRINSQNSEYTYDLADARNRFFVEILKEGNAKNRNEISGKIRQVRTHSARVSLNDASRNLIFVFENDLPEIERQFYSKTHTSDKLISYAFFDRDDILKMYESQKLSNQSIPNILQNDISQKTKSVIKQPISNLNPENDTSYGDSNNSEMNELKMESDESISSAMNLVTDYSKLSALLEISGELNTRDTWWINADERFLKQGKAEIGDTYRYPIKAQKRNRSNFGKLRRGHWLIGYNKSPKQEIYGIFEFIDREEDAILIEIIFLFEKRLKYNEIKQLKNFIHSPLITSRTRGALFHLEIDQFINLIEFSTTNYEAILKLLKTFREPSKSIIIDFNADDQKEEEDTDTQHTLVENTASISPFSNDGTDGEDYLSITRDVKAFAKIIASKEISPPLSIALFGKWGSGKSFFMDKLQEEIEDLSNLGDTSPFCSKTLQIHFNAWAYLDADLWASFGSIIFEEIFNRISSQKSPDYKGDKNEHFIIRELSTYKAFKAKVDAEIQSTENQIAKIDLSIHQQKSTLENHSELSNILSEDTRANILSTLPKGRLKDSLEYSSDLKSFVKETTRFIKSIPIIFSKKQKTVLKIASVLIPILITFGIVAIIYFNSWENSYKILTSAAAFFVSFVLTSKVVFRFTPTIKAINDGIALQKLEEAELKRQQVQLINQKNQLEAKIELLKKKRDQNPTFESFKAMITEIYSNEKYTKHLGIVSQLRDDLKNLSHYFLQMQDDVSITEEERGIIKKIDRIVLYIDDLDRCSEERVIQVLEAVNLLLAFPLFVVVVGVDKRWVRNALITRYHNQFGRNRLNPAYEKIEAEDYLEKIFQIPFQLKDASSSEIKNMISKLSERFIAPPAIPTEPIPSSKKTEDKDLSTTEQDKAALDVQKVITEEPKETKKEDSEATYSSAPIQNEENLPTIVDAHLELSPFELKTLPEFEFLLGSNPRTIKRFINIYRIVRAHESLPITKNPERWQLSVMFLVAFSVGIYKKNFLELLEICNNRLEAFKTLEEAMLKVENSNFISAELNNHPELKRILSTSYNELKKLIFFIGRFSFSMNSAVTPENKNYYPK